jgi:hypothetical protein
MNRETEYRGKRVMVNYVQAVGPMYPIGWRPLYVVDGFPEECELVDEGDKQLINGEWKDIAILKTPFMQTPNQYYMRKVHSAKRLTAKIFSIHDTEDQAR